MRISRMTPSLLLEAVDIYLRQAFPQGRPADQDLLPLRAALTIEEALASFERPRAEEGVPCQRFALRLGNPRYPFMKIVLQEYLVRGEFFFTVDTHDELRVDKSAPDLPAWQELREYNRALKAAIEGAWRAAGLPTFEDLRELSEELAKIECSSSKTAHILVVDDETSVARGIGALLAARGHRIELFHDGDAVLKRLLEDPLPDLVILDYAMPGRDGWEVLERLRADPRTESLKILLATASDLDLAMLSRASALLKKPFPRELLFELVERLVP